MIVQIYKYKLVFVIVEKETWIDEYHFVSII